MTRQEYLSELNTHLMSLPDEERNDAVRFYEEYFEDAGIENEAAVMEELGKPYTLAKSIICEQSAYSKSHSYAKYRESQALDRNRGNASANEDVTPNGSSKPHTQYTSYASQDSSDTANKYYDTSYEAYKEGYTADTPPLSGKKRNNKPNGCIIALIVIALLIIAVVCIIITVLAVAVSDNRDENYDGTSVVVTDDVGVVEGSAEVTYVGGSYSKTYPSYTNLKGINIDIPYADVYIYSDYDYLGVDAYDINSEFLAQDLDENGILTINYTESTDNLVDYAFDLYDGTPTITVYLPDAIELSEVSVSMIAGTLYISEMNAERLDAKITAGDLNLDMVTISEEFKIESGAGDITINECNLFNKTEISNTAGDIFISASRLTGNSEIKATAGDVELDLIGDITDYTFDIKRGVGDISINDERRIPDTSGENTLKVTTVAGDCDIEIYE